MNNDKPFCTVPFVEAFSGVDSAFRNCCATDPQIASLPGQAFADWQQDSRLIEFRKRMYTNEWQSECYRCRVQEEESGTSFRTAVNSAVKIDDNFGLWPSRWNLKFGNICNLACWTCNEYSSSVIAQHKKTINILPDDFVDPEQQFQTQWATLKADVLKSYDYHNVVTLTLLGGEPMYNKTVIEFLTQLVDLGLASRTRLEFHTNATKINQQLLTKNLWNYVCVFLSLDAVGTKAEWLRYGSRWTDIESNIDFFKARANYVEVHCTLSILNINDLPQLDKFCKSRDLPLKIMLLSAPDYMSIMQWPGDKHSIIDNQDNQFEYYYNLIGNNPDNTSIIRLKDYINQYQSIRQNLADFDPTLARAIGLD
jgi:organic radical activating enzyme